jgi:hypothetical protein
VCFFWKIVGGREMGSITIPKAKVESMAGMPAATFKASLERLCKVGLPGEHGAIRLFESRDRHRYGFEITRWTGGPDGSRAGFFQPPSTPDFVPPIAILNRCTETEAGKPRIAGGDRGTESLQPLGVDRGPNRTRAAAKLEGGWVLDEYQN